MDPKNTPPLGIILPTYNRMDALPRCLEHLEAQTWKDFEVVVVDDGSTDGTAAFLARYAQCTPLRFRYVRQDNTGPAGARNHAVSLLQAPVCLIIGDDIMAHPEFVATHLGFHRSHPGRTSFAVGLTRWSEQGQTVTPFMRWLETGKLQFAYADLLGGMPPTWEHFYTSNLSGKTEHLRAHPFDTGFTRNVMEDVELGYRLSRKGALDLHFLAEAQAEHIHPTDVIRSCRRMMSAGFANSELIRRWPERQPPTVPATLWRRVRRRFLQSSFCMAVLRTVVSVLTRLWCPNPLLGRALLLHHEAGLLAGQSQNP